jgi:prophage tail gpP-like protein
VTSVVTVKIANQVFTEVTRHVIPRDVRNVAGTFQLTIVDEARIRNALIAQIGQPTRNAPIKAGDPISIAIDNEVILVGWIEQPHFTWAADRLECHISGRDKTGDLVECAALPRGPTEFRGVDLLHVASLVCAPFGIIPRADVDIGAPFDRLSLHKHMTAMAFLESAARQRAILLTSDGVGGLVLTRGGATRAPAPLRIGDNVQVVEAEDDWTRRFSDYFVMQDTAKKRAGGPAMDHTATPLSSAPTPSPTPAANSAAEATAIGTVGHATDPEITRWRPTVRLTRSQSGMSTVQEQAEWMCRVAKGDAQGVRMTVLGHRAGPRNMLWRPNQVCAVWDPYSDIDRDMLIAGVEFLNDEGGQRTQLHVVGVTALDRINEADRRRSGKARKSKPNLDTTATPLNAP